MSGVGAAGGRAAGLVEPGAGGDRAAAPHAGLPDLAVVTCVDLGCDALAALGLRPGDAHVLTNAGGVVTSDVVRDLVAARRALGVRRVTVVQHHGCAFATTGAPPPSWPAGATARLRACLARLEGPPLRLPRDAVAGVLVGPDGAATRVAPGP